MQMRAWLFSALRSSYGLKSAFSVCLSITLAFCFVFPAQSVFARETNAVISQNQFLSSDFPRLFKSKQFEKALKLLDRLLKQYPQDPLLQRYRGLTLDKLNRRQEAIAVYKQILIAHPDHAPTRLFLGLAYAREGQRDAAARELRWVAENSGSSEYRHWAQAQLTRLRQLGRKSGKRVVKKPYLAGKVGVFYDSNPLLIPSDENLSSREKEDGADYSIDLKLGYPVLLRKDRRLDLQYVGRELLHDGGASRVDFSSHGVALDGKRRLFLGKRSFLLGARYDFKANFLRSDLFAVINRVLFSADSSFFPKTRTHLYTRFSYSNYGPDGIRPSESSRDGFRGGLGVIQYFYYGRDARSYVFLKQEGSFSETRGDNFDRVGSLSRLGLHTPLEFLGATDLDLSVGFDYGTYPEFSSLSVLEPDERRDIRSDYYGALTHHWSSKFATRLFYRFINSDNDNGFYERDRHIAGAEVVFSL